MNGCVHAYKETRKKLGSLKNKGKERKQRRNK
jgi:hypothetical protein